MSLISDIFGQEPLSHQWLSIPIEVVRLIVETVFERLKENGGVDRNCHCHRWGCYLVDIRRSEYAALPMVNRQFLTTISDYCMRRSTLTYHHEHPRDISFSRSSRSRQYNVGPATLKLPLAPRLLASHLREVQLCLCVEKWEGGNLDQPTWDNRRQSAYESLVQLLSKSAATSSAGSAFTTAAFAGVELMALERVSCQLESKDTKEEGFRLETILGLNPVSLELQFETQSEWKPPPLDAFYLSPGINAIRLSRIHIDNTVNFGAVEKELEEKKIKGRQRSFPTQRWIEVITGLLFACESLQELHIELGYRQHREGDGLEGWIDIYYAGVRAMSEEVLGGIATIRDASASIRVQFRLRKTIASGNGYIPYGHPLFKLGQQTNHYRRRCSESVAHEIVVVEREVNGDDNVRGGGCRAKLKGQVGRKTVHFYVGYVDWTDLDD